ncbi:hypothetical protein BW727_100761 [Jeotgalibaca dankookensis]|uniref:Pit accessory protein n=2 Tax=Jeotgalibaca dankookensis TaxID=708126 RepID=A0A1S6INM4_9LACT|nr:hypothetical protein BW727_100761 [Jeotgalibaca dankookensis]
MCSTLLKKKKRKILLILELLRNFSLLMAEATDFLAANLKNYQLDELENELNEMKKIEVVANDKKQATLDFLYQDFLPPIERPDILEITQALNTLLGTVSSDILARLDRYQVKTIEPDVFVLVEVLKQGSDKTLALTKELIHFKHPEKLLALMKDINSLVRRGYALHHQAIKKMMHNENDAIVVFSYSNIYEGFNRSWHALERLTRAVEAMIIQNT